MVSHEGTRIRSCHFLIGPCVHGQTYVYMAWSWHVALSIIKASCKLTTISHSVIDSSDIVLSLLLSLQRVHCSHVWVWVMHDGSVDVRMIRQYRRWSLSRSCPSYTHANTRTCTHWVYSAWQMCVRERKRSMPTCGISTSGTWLPLAKNQLPTQAPEWITVPGIAHLNPTEPERMLCPVKQLKLYIRDSERIRGGGGGGGGGGGRQRMFIHWNRSIRDIMRSHISRWIVETVKEAYTQADRQYDRVTAHEVRALSALWAYNCLVALPDILSEVFWRSSGMVAQAWKSHGI